MRPLAGAWYADQETNSNGEKLLEFCSTHDLKIVNTLFKKRLSRLITWRHPRGSDAVIDYILSDRNTVWRDMRASWGGSTGHHSDHAKLVGVVLPPEESGKMAFDGESFLRKSSKRKSPGLRFKTNTCLKSAQGRSFLTSDNRLSHTDSIESFNRTLKELVCNVHARLPVPEPEEKMGTFFEYLNTEQRRSVHRQVLNNRTEKLVAARKRLNLKCNKLRKFAQNEMLESGLEGYQDKHVLGLTSEAFKVLKGTLRSVCLS